VYRGNVVRNDSLDPNYRIKFSFISSEYTIVNGYAMFTRCAPVPKVVFDDYTDYLIEQLELDEQTIQRLKLEVGKTVCDYIFSNLELKKL